ncbi:MAG: efflux RND transporter periplasmic adaptor subunit [Pirellula sp.]
MCSAIDGTLSAIDLFKSLALHSPLAREAGMEKIQKIVLWLLYSGLAQEIDPRTDAQSETSTFLTTANVKPTKTFDPSSFRIPLVASEPLDKITGHLTWLISWPCLLLALATICVALVTAIQNSQELVDLGRKLFVPGSQWWWLIAWAVLKAVHESGHAIACARAGAKSNGAGIGFMFFAPMPYVDVTNLWQIENKWSRALVSAAGMLFEITFASIAILVACNTENTSIRYLCFAIATLGTFTTIAFNGNPLMRFDGYYIFVDLVGRPNLWQDSSKSMKSFFSSWIYKDRDHQAWSVLLLTYGFASWVTRSLILLTMAWGLWMTWDGLGLVVVSFFIGLWFVLPLVTRFRMAAKLAKPWTWRGTLESICPRKAIRCACAAGVLGLCCFLPSPVQVYWPATVEYVEPLGVRTDAAGFVKEVFVHDGQGVREGDEVLRLSNPSLELEHMAALSMLRSSEEKCTALRAQKKHSDLQAEEANQASLLVKWQILDNKVKSLALKAPRSGVLLARMSQNLPGSFIPEGQSIGMIVDPSQIEVRASIPQDAWDVVAHNASAPVSIYLFSGQRLFGRVLETMPRTSDQLDSPSLGGIYGGPIAVVLSKDTKGEEQIKTQSPRLQTRIQLDRSGSMPPPGALCSVKLTQHTESIWQTGYRWLKAAVQVQFNTRA